MAIPLCDSLPPDGHEVEGSEMVVHLLQTIPTVITGGFLLRTAAHFQIVNKNGFVIHDATAVSANYRGLLLYNNTEDKGVNERPIVGGPDFNTEVDTDNGPYYVIPEGGKLVIKSFGSFHRKVSWITIAGFKISLRERQPPDVAWTTILEYYKHIVGSGLYGCRNTYTHSYTRNFFSFPNELRIIGDYYSSQPTCEIPMGIPKFISFMWDKFMYLSIPNIQGWNLYAVYGGTTYLVNELVPSGTLDPTTWHWHQFGQHPNATSLDGAYLKAVVGGTETAEEYPVTWGYDNMQLKTRFLFDWMWNRWWDVIVAP